MLVSVIITKWSERGFFITFVVQFSLGYLDSIARPQVVFLTRLQGAELEGLDMFEAGLIDNAAYIIDTVCGNDFLETDDI